MSNFAYNDKQVDAVNLDNVDKISKSLTSEGKFLINFYKIVGSSDHGKTTTIDVWTFDSEEERDRAFSQMTSGNHGSYFGYTSSPSVF